jgi:hypothetical protein
MPRPHQPQLCAAGREPITSGGDSEKGRPAKGNRTALNPLSGYDRKVASVDQMAEPLRLVRRISKYWYCVAACWQVARINGLAPLSRSQA